MNFLYLHDHIDEYNLISPYKFEYNGEVVIESDNILRSYDIQKLLDLISFTDIIADRSHMNDDDPEVLYKRINDSGLNESKDIQNVHCIKHLLWILKDIWDDIECNAFEGSEYKSHESNRNEDKVVTISLHNMIPYCIGSIILGSMVHYVFYRA